MSRCIAMKSYISQARLVFSTGFATASMLPTCGQPCCYRLFNTACRHPGGGSAGGRCVPAALQRAPLPRLAAPMRRCCRLRGRGQRRSGGCPHRCCWGCCDTPPPRPAPPPPPPPRPPETPPLRGRWGPPAAPSPAPRSEAEAALPRPPGRSGRLRPGWPAPRCCWGRSPSAVPRPSPSPPLAQTVGCGVPEHRKCPPPSHRTWRPKCNGSLSPGCRIARTRGTNPRGPRRRAGPRGRADGRGPPSAAPPALCTPTAHTRSASTALPRSGWTPPPERTPARTRCRPGCPWCPRT
mmetsp:Transcript_6377/g.18356  ORF Transcript_6377/g.18356 Transcript_6377/m.18356 type:complete len:294 (+) Transcript_6377:2357-3238(+)